jgi:hypothetical protein
MYTDGRMKQAQSATSWSRLADDDPWWSTGTVAPRPMGVGRRRVPSGRGPRRPGLGRRVAGLAWASAWGVLSVLAAAGWLIALPFRLTFWAIAWLGRLAAIAIGFAMMVAGIFFLAGPFFLPGIPLFLIGLVLTLRCLD